jgi:predicted permease
VSERDLSERVLRRCYRVLLRAYPPEFRAEYGTDMEETFTDRSRGARARGLGSLLVFLAVATADAVANGLAERFTPHGLGSMLHVQDIRYAFRLLRRSPVFTALTVVVLGGGLGLSIFTFSFLHTAMLKPLPVIDGDRIVSVQRVIETNTSGLDAVDAAAMRPAIRTLSEVGVFTMRDFVIGDEGHRRVISAVVTEWNIFQITRTGAALGRGLRPDDQLPGAEPVVVLSHRVWRVLFGSDSSVVGRRVEMSGILTRVVGVMPEGYGFPVAAESWVPIPAAMLESPTTDMDPLRLFGRIAPGVAMPAVETELALLLERVRGSRIVPPGQPPLPRAAIVVRTFPMAQFGDEGPVFFTVLNLIATLILLLACINVINLLLARANERARETAVRLALGASRARLVMQSMWESVLLCLAGGGLATAGAAWGLGAINRWTHANLEGNLAFWWVWGVDRTTLIAAGGFITLAIAVLGAVVSSRAASTSVTAVLSDGGARAGGRRQGRTARILVVTQVATVSVLMFFGVMSGIIARRITTIDPGHETRDLLSTWVAPPSERYKTTEQRLALYRTMVDGVGASSGVSSVLLRARLADNSGSAVDFEIADARAAGSASRPRAWIQATMGSLGTLDIVVRSGRSLEAHDAANGAPVAVVSESLAREHWQNGSPIGKQIRLSGVDSTAEWRTIVGVVSDIPWGDPLSKRRSPIAIYVPLAQVDAPAAVMVFRHRGDAVAGEAAYHRTLAAADPRLIPDMVTRYDEMLEKATLITRATTKLFASCFAFALLLAISGTYGLMARSIGQRTREIGVRRALGATDGVVVRLLLGQGGRQLGVGVAVAIPVMLATGAAFWHFFPVGLVASLGAAVLVTGTIVSVVLLATYVPTRRVLKVALRDALWRDS